MTWTSVKLLGAIAFSASSSPGQVFPETARVDDQEPERRKIIFDPVPRVDGMDSSGDPLTQVRADIYLLSGRRRRAALAGSGASRT